MVSQESIAEDSEQIITGRNIKTLEIERKLIDMELNTDALCCLPIIDPPKWGWSALGGVVDLLTPQEVRNQ